MWTVFGIDAGLGALELAAKSVAVAAVALGLATTMRRMSAAHRHVVLAGAVAALLVLPVAAVVGPRWHAGWIPVTVPSGGPGPNAAVSDVGPAVSPAEGPGGTAASWVQPRRAGPTPTRSRGSVPWVLAGWVAGALLLAGRLLGGRLLVDRIVRAAAPVTDAGLLQAFDSVRAACLPGRTVALAWSERSRMPFAARFWRPVLVIPAHAIDWPRERFVEFFTTSAATSPGGIRWCNWQPAWPAASTGSIRSSGRWSAGCSSNASARATTLCCCAR